jgi:hypothetical protein
MAAETPSNLQIIEQAMFWQKRAEAERDRLRDGIQDLLDDAWIRLPAEAEEHLRELLNK